MSDKESAEPVARLLHWKGPSHMPVQHKGICARTFAEYPKDTPVENRYWFEGEPLYTAPPNLLAENERLREALEAIIKDSTMTGAALTTIVTDNLNIIKARAALREPK